MQTVRLRFTKIELIDYNRRDNVLKVHFFFEENGKLNYVADNLSMTEDLGEFVKDFLSSLRTTYKKKYENNSYDNDILSGYVNVLLEEKEDGHTETKLFNALRKFREKIRGFRTTRSAEGYMDKYHQLQGQSVDL